MDSYRARYQAFNADATRINTGDQRELFDLGNNNQNHVSIAAGPNGGNAILVYAREVGGDTELRLREIKPDGSLGNRATIELAGEDLTSPQISMNASGYFAVAFENSAGNGTIEVLRYDNTSMNLDGGTVITANTTSAGNQLLPSIALADNGHVLAIWEDSQVSGNGRDVVMQEIDASGALVGGAIVINPTTNGNQEHPDVVLAGSTVLAVWDGQGPLDNDNIMLTTAQLIIPEILVTPSGAVTGEDGSFVDVDFELATQPADDVVITISSSDPGEGTPSLTTLTFTGADWDTSQTVRITGQDDLTVDGNVNYQIDYSVSSVGDSSYDGLSNGSVGLTNQDNDVPSISDVGSINDSDAALNQVPEDAIPGTTVGITALAIDPDPIDTVSYALTTNPGSLFAIDPVSGIVTLNTGASLDREAQASHTITVQATSTDTSVSERDFTINVLDINDNAPVISGTGFSLPENSPNNTLVGTPSASDLDTTGTSQNWSIVGGTGATAFRIDPVTGEIRVDDQNQLDHETVASLTLDLTVSDGVNTSATQTITVSIDDQPEAPLGGNSTITVDEDIDYPVLITDIAFSDVDDGDQLSSITIDTLPGSGSLELDNTPVTVNQSVSRAEILAGDLVYKPAQHVSGNGAATFAITVADFSGLPSAVQNIITVNINEIDDPPQITSDGGGVNAAVNVVENTTAVTTVAATDADLPAQTLTYSIVPVASGGAADGPLFLIDPGSGALSFNAPPDFETPGDDGLNNVYDVTVQVSDGISPPITQTIGVTVTDQLEPIVITAPATVNGIEDTDLTLTGVSGLNVVDLQNAAELSISIGVDNGAISLAQTTGLVFSAGDGLMDSTVTFTGSASDLNLAIGALQYSPPENYAGVANLTVTASDPSDMTRIVSHPITVNISAVNDPPVVAGTRNVGYEPASEAIIDTTVLSASDVEDSPVDLTFTLDVAPTVGVLRLNGTPLLAGMTFTQADIQSGSISYDSLPATETMDSLTVSVQDSDGATASNIQISIEAVTNAVSPPSDSGSGNGTTPGRDSGSADSTVPGNDAAESGEDDNAKNSAAVLNPPLSYSGGANGGAQVADSGNGQSEGRSSTRQEASQNRDAASGRRFLDNGNVKYDGLRVSELERRIDPLATNAAQSTQISDIRFGEYQRADLAKAIEHIRDETDTMFTIDRRIVASSAVVSSGLSIGYVIWLLRSGALLTSVLASMPAWRSIDPLPVLSNLDLAGQNNDDDESLEELLKPTQVRVEPDPAPADPAATNAR